MRLIDADTIEWHEQLSPMGNGQYEYARVAYMDDIDVMPTIEPERNGGWVHRKLIYSDISIATCTICGKCVPVGNFCKNCGSYNGAKMEEGEQE